MAADGEHLEMGVIDLLYLGPHGWTALDFKTDEIRDGESFGEGRLATQQRACHPIGGVIRRATSYGIVSNNPGK
jgi:hypothetical protein